MADTVATTAPAAAHPGRREEGEMLGVSEPRISQLHSRAMTRLKGILESAA